MADRLYRSRDDRMLTGVAGGVAETLDADPSLIRIVWALLVILTGGIALIVYIVMAIVVPERPEGMPIARSGPGPVPGEEPSCAGPTRPVARPGRLDGATGRARPRAASRRRRDPADQTRVGLIAGFLLIVLGGFFLIRQLLPALDLGLWWPLAAIVAGVLLVVVALLPPRRPS